MQAKAGISHTAIFSVLVILALVTVALPLLHLDKIPHNAAIFSVAFVMAALVAVQYMNLKVEGALIYWLVGIPFLLFAVLVIILIPEFVWNHTILTPSSAPTGGH